MDVFSLQENILILSFSTLLLSAAVFWISPWSLARRSAALTIILMLSGGMALGYESIYANYLEKLHYQETYSKEQPYKYVSQNRSGIIAVSPAKEAEADAMWGGGIYDGMFNIDPIGNSNGIRRCFMISGLHRNPTEVLEIGLSTASWARVLASYGPIRQLTVVEINRAYPDLVRKYPEIASVLDEEHVDVEYDDGRRWLNRHLDASFDMIVMNTTFHWRSHVSNMLSLEFMEILKSHLNPNGVIYFNSTSSDDVSFTALAAFKYVTKYEAFIAASDSPFDLSYAERKERLLQFKDNSGRVVFDATDPQKGDLLEKLATDELPDLRKILGGRKDLWVISDDNMATEYKNPLRYRVLAHTDERRRWSSLLDRVLN
jgi:predicted O-methyltransferase YrrM